LYSFVVLLHDIYNNNSNSNNQISTAPYASYRGACVLLRPYDTLTTSMAWYNLFVLKVP